MFPQILVVLVPCVLDCSQSPNPIYRPFVKGLLWSRTPHCNPCQLIVVFVEIQVITFSYNPSLNEAGRSEGVFIMVA